MSVLKAGQLFAERPPELQRGVHGVLRYMPLVGVGGCTLATATPVGADTQLARCNWRDLPRVRAHAVVYS